MYSAPSSSQDPKNPGVNMTNNANASMMKKSIPILHALGCVAVHMTLAGVARI